MKYLLGFLVLIVRSSIAIELKAEILMKPTTVGLNGDVELTCSHTANGMEIYDISFYKDGKQLYFFRPQMRRHRVFRDLGVLVKYSEDGNTIYLIRAVKVYEGQYWCEVTLESNFIAAESSHVNLTFNFFDESSKISQKSGAVQSLTSIASVVIVIAAFLVVWTIIL